MKRLFVILIVGLFLLTACVTVPHKVEVTNVVDKGYSYESMVDPYLVETWDELKVVSYGYVSYRGTIGYLAEIFYKNPKDDAQPVVASVFIIFTERGRVLQALTYLYNEELYLFRLDDNHCFKYEELSDEQKGWFKGGLLDALDGDTT